MSKKPYRNTTIGSNIKKIRAEKSITQKNLSDFLDCSLVQINNIENHKSHPRTKNLVNIANALNVPLSRLVDTDYNAKKHTHPCEDWFHDLSSPASLFVLKLLWEFKRLFNEYKAEILCKEQFIAEDIDYGSAGKNIAKMREVNHINLHTMSKRMNIKSGMSPGTYRNIESNNGTASIERYMEIAEEFNLSVDSIFDKSLRNKEAICHDYISMIFDGSDIKDTLLYRKLSEFLFKLIEENKNI